MFPFRYSFRYVYIFEAHRNYEQAGPCDLLLFLALQEIKAHEQDIKQLNFKMITRIP